MMETCAGNGNAAGNDDDDDDDDDDNFRAGGEAGGGGLGERGKIQIGGRRTAEEMNSKRGYSRCSARIYSRGLSI